MSTSQKISLGGVIIITAIFTAIAVSLLGPRVQNTEAAAVRNENLIFTLATGSADSSLSVPGITSSDEVRSVVRFPGNATADSFDIAIALTTPRVVNADSVRFLSNYTATTAAKWLVVWRDRTN